MVKARYTRPAVAQAVVSPRAGSVGTARRRPVAVSAARRQQSPRTLRSWASELRGDPGGAAMRSDPGPATSSPGGGSPAPPIAARTAREPSRRNRDCRADARRRGSSPAATTPPARTTPPPRSCPNTRDARRRAARSAGPMSASPYRSVSNACSNHPIVARPCATVTPHISRVTATDRDAEVAAAWSRRSLGLRQR